MTTHRRTELCSALLARVAAVMLLAPQWPAAVAGVNLEVAAASSNAAPAGPGYPTRRLAPYPRYYDAGACLHFGACSAWARDERYAPRRPVAPDEPAPAEQDIWGTVGSPWGYVRRLPPPTPESHIQPRYKDASTVRPEFGQPSTSAAPR